jgi:hypothetical protein
MSCKGFLISCFYSCYFEDISGVERESKGQHIILPKGKKLLWFLPAYNRKTFFLTNPVF